MKKSAFCMYFAPANLPEAGGCVGAGCDKLITETLLIFVSLLVLLSTPRCNCSNSSLYCTLLRKALSALSVKLLRMSVAAFPTFDMLTGELSKRLMKTSPVLAK